MDTLNTDELMREESAMLQLRLNEAIKLLRGNGYLVYQPVNEIATPDTDSPLLPIAPKRTGMYSPRELASVWGVDYSTVLRFIHDGDLEAVRVGHSYLITEEAKATYQKSHTTKCRKALPHKGLGV